MNKQNYQAKRDRLRESKQTALGVGMGSGGIQQKWKKERENPWTWAMVWWFQGAEGQMKVEEGTNSDGKFNLIFKNN